MRGKKNPSSVSALAKKPTVVTVVTVISSGSRHRLLDSHCCSGKCCTCMTVANRPWIIFSKSFRLPFCPRAGLALPSPGRFLSNWVFQISSDEEGNVFSCHSCCLFHSLRCEKDGISTPFFIFTGVTVVLVSGCLID